MSNQVQLTIDGQAVSAPKGTLVIEAAKRAGIEIPAFCYYEGYSLQAACRMCLVEVEKAPKLLPGCTLPVAEGMVVRTDSPKVVEARKSMLEFLLSNHPLDCPVCDKGGECELQDMAFRYGLGESRFTEIKQHVDEKQWSPLVYFDAPRCILCYRCVRVCDEGLGVRALGVGQRGVATEIIPNAGDHLECDECGNCIDICPVGALTSGTYRYKSRPWEMSYAGTICTHCADGCKTTLSVRNGEIIRANNRDRSGINGEFLCVKGALPSTSCTARSGCSRRSSAATARSSPRVGARRWPRLPRGSPRCRRATANSASSVRPIRATRRTTICRSSRGPGWARRTSITGARATSRLSWTR